ncbi:MAG: hypothetical protein U0361_14470 [Nitrospiraceae bacterium]
MTRIPRFSRCLATMILLLGLTSAPVSHAADDREQQILVDGRK